MWPGTPPNGGGKLPKINIFMFTLSKSYFDLFIFAKLDCLNNPEGIYLFVL
jgi:hypothetical protein